MPEVPIDDLLRALDDAAEPDPAFAARLRSEVARVLAQREPDDDDAEVLDMDVTSSDVVAPKRPFRLLAAAAVVTIAALMGGALVLGGDDDGGEIRSADASADFAGGAPEKVATVSGANPYYVANASYLWVLTLGGQLQQLDAETGDVLASTRVSESSPMVATDDAVWIGDAITGEVVRIDPETLDVVATIETGIAVDSLNTRGVGLAHDMGARRDFALLGGLHVAGDDSVWVGDRGGRLLRIDAATNEVSRTLDVGIRPDIVRVDGGHVLIGDYAQRLVEVLDASSGEVVARFGPVEALQGADLRSGAAYVQDAKTGVVTRVDVTSGEEVRSEPLGPSWKPGGVPVYSAGVRVGGGGVLAETEQELVVLDPRTLERRGSFEVDGHGGELFIDSNGVAWLVRYTTNEILRITPAS